MFPEDGLLELLNAVGLLSGECLRPKPRIGSGRAVTASTLHTPASISLCQQGLGRSVALPSWSLLHWHPQTVFSTAFPLTFFLRSCSFLLFLLFHPAAAPSCWCVIMPCKTLFSPISFLLLVPKPPVCCCDCPSPRRVSGRQPSRAVPVCPMLAARAGNRVPFYVNGSLFLS